MAVSILVIDPDEGFLELLLRRLRRGDALASGRTTAAEALQFLREVEPDIIVLNPALGDAGPLIERLQKRETKSKLVLLQDPSEAPAEADGARVVSRSTDIEALAAAIVSAVEKPAGRPQVLIVDDDPEVLGLFARVLTRAGYTVERAMTSEEALGQLDRHPTLQLVVLDLVVPTHGGIEVLGLIRQRGQKPHVIVVSAVSDRELFQRAKSLGAVDYLIKPILPGELVEAVGKAMAGR